MLVCSTEPVTSSVLQLLVMTVGILATYAGFYSSKYSKTVLRRILFVARGGGPVFCLRSTITLRMIIATKVRRAGFKFEITRKEIDRFFTTPSRRDKKS